MSLNQVNNGFTGLVTTMNNLNSTYGQYELRKVIPSATWGDIIRTNKRTGETVVINEWSQVFTLKFDTLVPIDSLINLFESFPFVEYAHQPIQALDQVTPNDSLYGTGDQWNLTKIDAEAAWDITQGSSSIKVAVIETKGVNFRHPELQQNLFYWDNYVYTYGLSQDSSRHGTGVAGIVAATTDNDTMVASLGWNLGLIGLGFYDLTDTIKYKINLPAVIDTAVDLGADVINFSFKTTKDGCPFDYQSVREAVADAISQGVVVVAAYGSDDVPSCFDPPPFPQYPAMYPNVIGVTATDSLDSAKTNWNYGDSVDVAAPGLDITVLDIEYGNYTYSLQGGTSIAAPQVAALAGLILSVDNTLTPKEVETIIEKSAEKVGQFSYTNGWNQYMGYGRINAFYAVAPPSKPTGLSISGSSGQSPTISWNSNPEPDIKAYKIYRKRVGTDNDYVLIATVNAPGTSYTDNGITIYVGKFSAYVYYKIKAGDFSDQLSPFSNWVRTKYRNQVEQKMLSEIQIPVDFALHIAFPNPFNPTTSIRYDLPEESLVVLKIYDLMGREVKTIVDGTENAGFKNIMWDSKDNNGRPVSSGMYFYKLDAFSTESDKQFHETKKMVLLR